MCTPRCTCVCVCVSVVCWCVLVLFSSSNAHTHSQAYDPYAMTIHIDYTHIQTYIFIYTIYRVYADIVGRVTELDFT